VESWRAPDCGSDKDCAGASDPKLDTDVNRDPFEGVLQIERKEFWARYNSPERIYYGDRVKDKEGYWTSSHVSILCDGITTAKWLSLKRRLVVRGPFFTRDSRGTFDRHRSAPRRHGVAYHVGEVKTREIIRALLRNGMMPRKGHTPSTQLLAPASSRSASSSTLSSDQAKREKGCPIDMVFADPAPGSNRKPTSASRSLRLILRCGAVR